ncbi:hypothetical protein LSM04_004660 [Trypanosoma melophagium]|uniref:uncharacterized protein n=1 Tax=Trypanosoma melophagium TaxID=715481 RepID=UPI003519F923|nr:hypothetical protein LSM04_004660 [Trypanosoma melophagium]
MSTTRNNDNNTLDPHLSTLSPYKRAEYECVSGITTLRQALHKVTQLESHMDNNNNNNNNNNINNNNNNNSHNRNNKKNNSNSDSIMELTRARQSARYAHQQLDKLAKDAQRAARRAKNVYDADIKELLHHVDTAKRWYRECFRVVPTHEQREEKEKEEINEKEKYYYSYSYHHRKGLGATDLTTPLLHSESKDDNGHHTTISVTGDVEFQQYAAQVQHNTELSEAALDRIAHGIGRLRDNALQLTGELRTQEVLLYDVEQKVDTTTVKLSSLNAKLRRVIRSVRKTDCCVYVFCFLLLVAVIVVIIVLIKN